jgi:hypothetical protein
MLIIDGRFEWQFKQRDELKLNGKRQIASKRRVNHAAACHRNAARQSAAIHNSLLMP